MSCPNDPLGAHDFFKFADDAIVCRKCGEHRMVGQESAPVGAPVLPLVVPLPAQPWQEYPPVVWESLTSTGDSTTPQTGVTFIAVN